MRLAGRPIVLRYAGMAATTLLAVGAHGAGALPGGDPGSGLRTSGWAVTTGSFRWGLLLCCLGAVGLLGVWWRLGRLIDIATYRVPAGWLAGTGALWALPLLFAPPLGSRDVYSYACQGWLVTDGSDPYAVSPAAGSCPWLPAVAPAWRDSTAPYGPVAVALSAAAVRLGGELTATVGLLRALALLGGLAVAVALAPLARACGVRPAAALWLGLCTPLTAVHVVAGAHHDALVAGLVTAGLAAAVAGPSQRSRGLLAGALLGAAVAVKVTAVVAVPFAALLVAGASRVTVTDGRRATVDGRGSALLAGGGTVGAAAGVFLLATAAGGWGFGWLPAISSTTGQVQWTSVPTGVGMAVGYLLRVLGIPAGFGTAVTVARLVGVAVLLVLTVALCRRAWRRRDDVREVVACCGAVLAAVALLAPVFYPWYALAALAVLAASVPDRRRRDRLAIVTCGLTLLVLPNGLGVAVLTKVPGALLDVVLVTVVLRALLRRRPLPRYRPGTTTSSTAGAIGLRS